MGVAFWPDTIIPPSLAGCLSLVFPSLSTAPSYSLLNPTSRPLEPNPIWPSRSHGLYLGALSTSAAPPPGPGPSFQRYLHSAGSLRSAGGPAAATGGSSPGPSSVSVSAGAGVAAVRVWATGLACLSALPSSPPPRAHLTSRTGWGGRAGATQRVLLNLTGAGTVETRADPPRGTECRKPRRDAQS